MKSVVNKYSNFHRSDDLTAVKIPKENRRGWKRFAGSGFASTQSPSPQVCKLAETWVNVNSFYNFLFNQSKYHACAAVLV